jgi:hypothetical protein
MNDGKGKKRSISRIGESISLSYWPIIFLFGAFFVFILSKSRYGLSYYDSGVAALGAQRILNGQIPYRDLWTCYPPGALYLNAAAFKLFGASVTVLNVTNCIIALLILVCAFFITRHLAGQKYAAVASILLIAFEAGFSANSAAYGVLLALIACIYLFRLYPNYNMLNVIPLGLITGGALVFRLDMGLYLFISVCVALALGTYVAPVSTSRQRKLNKPIKIVTAYSAGVLLIAVPILILVLRAVPVHDLIDQLIVLPRIYPAYRSLPWPSLFAGDIFLRIFFYSSIFVYLIVFLLLLFQVTQRKAHLGKYLKPLFLLILGALFFIYGSIRVDIGHVEPTLIVAIILFAWLALQFKERIRLSVRESVALTTSVGINVTLILVVTLVRILMFYSAVLPLQSIFPGVSEGGSAVSLEIPRAQRIFIDPGEAQNLTDSIKFVQAHVPQNETIFVGNAQHQQIVANNAMFYFLAERDSATKYYDLVPGVATTAAVQQQIVNDLIRHNVEYVVLWNATQIHEPNQSQYKQWGYNFR